jgi:hypothetical protein
MGNAVQDDNLARQQVDPATIKPGASVRVQGQQSANGGDAGRITLMK